MAQLKNALGQLIKDTIMSMISGGIAPSLLGEFSHCVGPSGPSSGGDSSNILEELPIDILGEIFKIIIGRKDAKVFLALVLTCRCCAKVARGLRGEAMWGFLEKVKIEDGWTCIIRQELPNGKAFGPQTYYIPPMNDWEEKEVLGYIDIVELMEENKTYTFSPKGRYIEVLREGKWWGFYCGIPPYDFYYRKNEYIFV
jgi:hypothetical protein